MVCVEARMPMARTKDMGENIPNRLPQGDDGRVLAGLDKARKPANLTKKVNYATLVATLGTSGKRRFLWRFQRPQARDHVRTSRHAQPTDGERVQVRFHLRYRGRSASQGP